MLDSKDTSDLFADAEETTGYVGRYDITSYPNDFNIATLKSYIESDAIVIPSFQRNFVWDMQKSSRFIESLILGLPVPQLFLYERSKNKYWVVDGQQRLMTVYYYLKGRFPRKERRSEIRKIFDEQGSIPDEALNDPKLFCDFKLSLRSSESGTNNPLNDLMYEDLGEQKAGLDLQTIRCVMVRQNAPEDEDSSVYEIFNRLNTGGTNLKPQEIRACMYRSEFYDMLTALNNSSEWRRFYLGKEPDLNMRDIEVLLRAFAMLSNGRNYSTSMSKFLNDYSKSQMTASPSEIEFLRSLFNAFLVQGKDLPDNVFINARSSGKFNINLFEAVFVMTLFDGYTTGRAEARKIGSELIAKLAEDEEFSSASKAQTTNSSNVRKRLLRASEIFGVDWQKQ